MPNNDLPDDREILTAKISRQAAAGWRNFCDSNGVSITALIEVAGKELAAETMPPTVEARQRMIIQAREVDRLRRSRKK